MADPTGILGAMQLDSSEENSNLSAWRWLFVESLGKALSILRVILPRIFDFDIDCDFKKEVDNEYRFRSGHKGKKLKDEWDVWIYEYKESALICIRIFDDWGRPNPNEITLLHYLAGQTKK